jgi:hypothetical protein
MSDTEVVHRCFCPGGGPVAFWDKVTDRGYCVACASDEATSSRDVHLQFLSAITPLGVGETVECRNLGLDEYYDGVGEIIEISTEVRRGGTPVHPAYLVRLSDGRQLWYTSICLTRIRIPGGNQ